MNLIKQKYFIIYFVLDDDEKVTFRTCKLNFSNIFNDYLFLFF